MRVLRFLFLLVIALGAAPLWMMVISGLGLQMTAFEPDYYLGMAEEHGAAKLVVEQLVKGINKPVAKTEPAAQEPSAKAPDSLSGEGSSPEGSPAAPGENSPTSQAEKTPPEEVSIPAMAVEQMVGDLNSASMRPKLRDRLTKGLAEFQSFVWGGKKELRAEVEVGRVAEAFFQSSRGLMPKAVAERVEARLQQIPRKLDLALVFGPLREPMEKGWNARRLNLWIFATGLGLLFLLFFVVGGFGSGLRWLGLSWVLGGLGVGLGAVAWNFVHSEAGPSLLVVASPLNPYAGALLQALVDGAWSMMRNIGFMVSGVGLLIFFLGGAMSGSSKSDGDEGVDERQARTQPKKGKEKKKKLRPPVPAGRTLVGGLLSLAVVGAVGFFGLKFYKSFEGFDPGALRSALVSQAARALEKADEDTATADAVVAAAAKGVVPEELDEAFRKLLEGSQRESLTGVVTDKGLSLAAAEVRAWEVIDLGARMVKVPRNATTDQTGKFSLRVSPGAVVLLEARLPTEEKSKAEPEKKKRRSKKAKRKRGKRKKKRVKLRQPVQILVSLDLDEEGSLAELDLSGDLQGNLKPSLERLSKAYTEGAMKMAERRRALLARHGADDCAGIKAEHPDRDVCLAMTKREPTLVFWAESLTQGLERHQEPLVEVKEVETPLADADMERLMDELVLDNKAVQRFMSAEGRDKVCEAMVLKLAGPIRDKSRLVLEKKVLKIEDYIINQVRKRLKKDLAERLAERQTAVLARARDRVLEQLKMRRAILDVPGLRAYTNALFDRSSLLRGDDGGQAAFAGYDGVSVAGKLTDDILSGIRRMRTEEEDRLQRMIPWVRALQLYAKSQGGSAK